MKRVMDNAEKPLILVVEDDPAMRSLIAGAMRRLGDVLEASDGEAALAVARDRAPTLVCLDLTLPEASGFAVAARLRSGPLGDQLRILVISDRNSLGDRVQAQEAGADDFLSKPFRARELHDKARKWLDVALADKQRAARAATERKTAQQQHDKAAVLAAANLAAQQIAHPAANAGAAPVAVKAAPSKFDTNSIATNAGANEVARD